MQRLLEELERALTDLLQMGLATAGPDLAARFSHLAQQAENIGAHTASRLCADIGTLLDQRAHALEKNDRAVTAAVFRAVHYITLCRTRMTEQDIRDRWQEGGTE